MEPLRLHFNVACPVQRAFELWALQTSRWWPHGHSVSADPGLTVVFEPRAGGRIYERTTDGAEHNWGEVLVWNPPHRLTYLWHLRFERSDATHVDISFRREGEGTVVDLVHSGWENLGAEGPSRRDRNERGWSGVTARYRDACAELAG